MGRSLAAAFVTEKNLQYAKPFCSALFRFGGSVGDIYISDRDVTIGANAHQGCVSQWGEWRSLLDARDGAFPAVRMAVSIINFPIFGSPLKRFTDLWSGIGVEAIEISVYQNFKQVGTGTILQELIADFVMRPRRYTPYYCDLELIGISEKYLDKKEISWVITQADLPLADPDDVGKRANQVYGSPKTVLCHAVKAGIQAPLQEAMSAVTGYVRIAQDFYDLLPATDTVQIGDEKISYASKTTSPNPRLTSLTRGAGGTPIQSHSLNDNIVQVLTEYIYLAAGHAVKSISNAKVWRNGLGYPLAGGVTYEIANTTLISGKTVAIVKITVPPTILELPLVELSSSLGVSDGIAVVDGIGVNDGAGVSDTIAVIDNVGVNKSGTVTENIGISQPNNQAKWEQAGSDETLNWPAYINNPPDETFSISFPAQEKSLSSGNFIKKLSFKFPTSTGSEWYLVLPGGGTILLWIDSTQQAAFPVQVLGSEIWGLSLKRHPTVANPSAKAVNISSKSVSYNIDATVSKTGTVADAISVAKTGSASKGGAASKTGSVSKTGAASKSGTVSLVGAVTLSNVSTAEIVLGEYLTVDIEGYPDDGAGLYTGVADALIEKPADVIHHLARAVGGIPVARIDTAALVTARSDSPASYKFACVLGERPNLKELLIALGMQSRIRVEWPVDKLTARFLKSSYPAVTKTLTQENILERSSGETSLEIRRSDYEDLINVVDLGFGRDWTVAKDRNAFAKVYHKQDAASITKYGERQNPDRFLCDFIAASNDAMATDLGDFWLDYLKEVKRVVSGDFALDEFELLPGDLVALDFKSSIFDPTAFFGPGTPTIKFGPGQYKFSAGKVSEKFDGLGGANKFLVEEVRHVGGYDTQMAVVLREVA